MIAYIIKVSLCWILFYALYQLLYKKITFFSANRVYLIATLLLGACIPLLEYVTLFSQPYEAVNYVAPILMEVDQFQLMVVEEKSFDYAQLFLIIYLLGLSVVAGKFFLGMFKIYQLYAGATKEKKKNFTLVKTEKVHLPFSFYNCVFISDKLPLKEKIHTILEHELCHINERHTFDVLLVELIKIAFWCSPPIYLYKKELKQVHEYIADNVTLAHENKKEYGQLLLGQSSSGIELSLTHQFFNSHLKKRIQMMNQKKSSKKALVSYLALVPLLLFLGLSFSSYVSDSDDGNLGREIELTQMGETSLYNVTDKKTGKDLAMMSATVAQYLITDEPEKQPIISVFGEETDRPLSEVYPWDEKVCVSFTPPAKTMELYGDRGKNGMIAITINEGIDDSEKIIREKVAKLFSNRKDFEKKKQSVYNDLRTTFPKQLDFIRKMYVHKAIENQQTFILDDYSIVNLDDAERNLLRIDTITTFDYDTYEESTTLVKVYDNYFDDSDPKNEIRKKVASLFSNEKDFENNKQKVYHELRTEYPKELDFIRQMFLQHANENNKELILDDFSIVNVKNQTTGLTESRTVVPLRKVVSIDTITTFNFDTYEEKVEIVKNYETIEEPVTETEPSTILSIDTITTFDYDTYEESVKIVRTFGKKSQASDTKELQKGQLRSYQILNQNEDKQIYKVVQEMPRFPGCEEMVGTKNEKEECAKQKMLEFIYSNLKYPTEAREKGIEGVTVVQFVVEENGLLADIQLLREIGGGCGDASSSVVHKMNKMEDRWTPGKQNGKLVSVLYTLPIKFKLANDETTAEVAEKEEVVEKEEEKSPLLILDGEEVSPQDINSLILDRITVYKGAEAIEKFGSKGANGVVEMFTKSETSDETQENVSEEQKTINKIDVFGNLSKMEFNAFKLFPNPVNDQLNLSFISKEEGEMDIHLFDESGKILMHKTIQGKECNEIFDLSHVKTTKTLFLTISQNNKTHTQKVIRTE